MDTSPIFSARSALQRARLRSRQAVMAGAGWLGHRCCGRSGAHQAGTAGVGVICAAPGVKFRLPLHLCGPGAPAGDGTGGDRGNQRRSVPECVFKCFKWSMPEVLAGDFDEDWLRTGAVAAGDAWSGRCREAWAMGYGLWALCNSPVSMNMGGVRVQQLGLRNPSRDAATQPHNNRSYL